MRKTNNYSINFETETITITKKFGKAASQIGTPEFKEMKKLRNEFEGFSIEYKTIDKKENKVTYRNLTVETMKEFLNSLDNAEEALYVFGKVEKVADKKKGKYAIIKKWFLNHYKKEYIEWNITDTVDKEVSAIEKELDDVA